MRYTFILSLVAGIIITLALLVKQIYLTPAFGLSLPNFKDLQQAFIQTGDRVISFLETINQDSTLPQNPSPTPTSISTTQSPAPNPTEADNYQQTIDLPNGGKLKIKINTQTKTQVNTKPQDTCYRYTITHLDGSTSTLCYTKPDYDQLTQLGYQLASAKAFYQFYLKGAEDYQHQYEKTNSSIYLDAKNRSLEKADQENQKINQITYQMQEIEKRGW